ncbi:type II secretion system protein GspM [Coralloluteibacterium thermophilus]|uniref:Type II secretion system protein GspM n=1 Tax=Coralloluteibacterium thermophilum TaxID=2707049 RepID=A0ABV9NMU9_9GAMM
MSRLDALSARDRRVLAWGAAVAVLVLGWAWLLDPLLASREALRGQAAANARDLAWMRPLAGRLAAQGPAATAPADGRSLLARVDAGLREAGLASALAAVEPQGAGSVRVRLADADFDALVAWMEGAVAQGARIEEWSAQRSGAGRVDARLLLREGAP